MSEAFGLGSIGWNRPLLAPAGFPGYSPRPRFVPAAGPQTQQRPVRPTRPSRLIDFARRRGTPLLVFSLIGTSIAYGAIRGGGYAVFVEQYGTPGDIIARNVGFPVSAVVITGENGLTEAEIFEASGITVKNSLAFLDVAEVRERLRAVPLVKDVSVRKLYPDHLAIEITERQPHALWQQDGHLSVVAADGTVIDTMRDGRLADLPFVVGDGANLHVADYLALLA
ncbi:MAG: FtsQ-type POTRA domain-containing protein, partial [Xanthobacteraceae bacterium]|nr:FtsQ-type POTRA domain-containing protein [Xanthobacteraceae bacterium]